MPMFSIDGRSIYYEVTGEGDPAVVMGGWGTYCHGRQGGVPRAVSRRHQTLLFDYPGIGDSVDDEDAPATTERYAQDLAALLDHLGWSRVHIVGLVGLGACVGQELAISRPDLVRSLVMTGTWAKADPVFTDQLEGLRRAHLQAGFETFQLLVASFSFSADFYNANRDRLMGADGAWGELKHREHAHSRLVDACLAHDTLDRLGSISCPTFVLHAGLDVITRPDMTRLIEDRIPSARGETWDDLAHVIAGSDQRARFDRLLTEFYDEVESAS